MYRQCINKLDNINVTLMQSPKKPLCKIPIDYIESISLNWDDVHEMTLSIPSIIYKDGIKKENILYDRIKGKTQQIVLSNPDIRFVIDDLSINESRLDGTDTIYKVKTIKCKSFESTLTETLVLNEDKIYELYNEEKTGILNEFEAYNKNWKVKYISDMAKYEMGIIRKEVTRNIATNLSLYGQRDMFLWEYKQPILVYGTKSYINLKIKYKNVSTKYKGQLNTNLDFTHTIEELHTSISSIKAYYSKYEGDYCIKYVILFQDGIEKIEYRTFCFLDNMDLHMASIDLTYSNGEEIEDTFVRSRNIEQGEYKWIDLLRDKLSNGYDGLYVEFNTINREISVYNRSEYGEHHGLQFSYNNYVKGINKNIVGDDIVTKVRVTSSDFSIAEVNKFGGDIIYDYSYAYNNDIMTEELKLAWDQYIEFVNNNEGNLTNYREQKSNYNKELIKLESEKTAIDYDIQNLQVAQSVLFSQQAESGIDMNKEIAEYYDKIQERKNRFEIVMSAIAELNDKITLANTNISTLQEKYNFDTCGIFNDELLEELYDLTIYEEINDDSFTTAKELYENYLYLTYIRNNQGVEFSIDSVGFLENLIIPKGLTWNYYLELGSFVDLEDAEGIDVEERGVRIIGYTIDVKNKTINNITLTNRDRKVDMLSGFTKIRDEARRSNNFVNNNKKTWEQSRNTNKNINSIMNGIDLSKIGVSSSGDGVGFIQNKAGLFITDNNNYNNTNSAATRNIPDEMITSVIDKNGNENQIYIGRSLIALSNNGFKSCDVAVTGDRIVADVIKGKLLMGQELSIVGENGRFYVGDINSINDKKTESFGLKIGDGDKDMLFLGINKDNKIPVPQLEMYDSKGEVIFSNEYRVSEWGFEKERNIDKDANITMGIRVRDNVVRTEELILNLKMMPFVVHSKGLESYSSGELDINGTFTDLIIKGDTDSIKDKKQTIFKSTGITKQISDFTELSEYEYYLGETDGREDLGKVYLPTIISEEIETLERNIKSYDTESHTHPIDINLGKVSVSGKINIGSHSHQEIYGIFEREEDLPSDVSVYIDGVLVVSGINDDVELDLTEYFTDISSGLHTISISSETRGSILANVYFRNLSKWR